MPHQFFLWFFMIPGWFFMVTGGFSWFCMKSFFLLFLGSCPALFSRRIKTVNMFYIICISLAYICIIILAHNGQHRGDRVGEYSAYNSAIRERGQGANMKRQLEQFLWKIYTLLVCLSGNIVINYISTFFVTHLLRLENLHFCDAISCIFVNESFFLCCDKYFCHMINCISGMW